MDHLLYYISFSILIYFSILWIGYIIFLSGTFFGVLRKYKESEYNNIIATMNQNSLVPMTVVIPAYNEEERIINAIQSILLSDYKNVHLIVVNDGSIDNTLQILIDTYSLQKIPPAFRTRIVTGEVRAYYRSISLPNLLVIDKEHSPYANSAADCINAGLNVCQTPIYCTVDADTILEPEALSRMLFAYLSNPHCVAVGGDVFVPDTTKIKNGRLLETNIPSNPVLGVQVCEYLRSFSYGREGWRLYAIQELLHF